MIFINQPLLWIVLQISKTDLQINNTLNAIDDSIPYEYGPLHANPPYKLVSISNGSTITPYFNKIQLTNHYG